MKTDIKVALYEEKTILLDMLGLLTQQFNIILEKDINKLNDINEELEKKSKELANIEITRRHFVSDKEELKIIIDESNDENLKELYKSVVQVLSLLKEQYDVNEKLLQKELLFTKKMINFIKPSDNKASTYNSYGKIGR